MWFHSEEEAGDVEKPYVLVISDCLAKASKLCKRLGKWEKI